MAASMAASVLPPGSPAPWPRSSRASSPAPAARPGQCPRFIFTSCYPQRCEDTLVLGSWHANKAHVKIKQLKLLLSYFLLKIICQSIHYSQVRAECGLFGCVDQTLGNIGASIISGVNGTLVGVGTGISGIANGDIILVDNL